MAVNERALAADTDFARRVSTQFADEPEWLRQARQVAAQRYLSLPLPYRERTPLQKRGLEEPPQLTPDPQPVSADIWPTGGLLALSGREVLRRREPSADGAEPRVIFTDLRSLVADDPDRVRSWLTADPADDKFAALNQAAWQNGAVIWIPAGVRLPDPLVVVHLGPAGGGATLPRTLIVLEQDSEATVIEHYHAIGSGYERTLAAPVVDISVGARATLRYGAIEEMSESTQCFVVRRATVAQDGSIHWSIGAFGSGLEVSRQVTTLSAPGGSSESVTVFFGSGRQHHDIELVTVHEAPHTKSLMTGKGVMNGRARSVLTGVTEIRKGAKSTDARQKEQILMLSERSRADAIPSLRIDENDVFAGHSASAGPVDRNVLYYLMSRGIPEPEAVRLVVQGFLAPVVDAIPVDLVREAVWRLVERKVSHESRRK